MRQEILHDISVKFLPAGTNQSCLSQLFSLFSFLSELIYFYPNKIKNLIHLKPAASKIPWLKKHKTA
jgi:hypothetical protein